jgi:uncharacterized repeat protein (TIGR01451 family)
MPTSRLLPFRANREEGKMNMFSLFHSSTNEAQNVMETNMKTSHRTWRPGRWLMAAAVALGIGSPEANAQGVAKPAENLIIEQLRKLEKRPGAEGEREPRPDASLVFTKTGRQIDCDYVVYSIRFGLRANPDIWAAPAMKALLSGIKLDLKDQLPAGLSIVSTSIVGDVTDAGGVNPPSSATSTTATTDDTMTMADFRLSADDLNGDGSATDRYADIRITAKIDRAAFPAVTQVLNQAQLNATIAGGGPGGGLFVSHDPALPDDGDDSTGEKTKITIDVTKCDPPGGGDQPEEACFKVEQGEVECGKAGDGTYTYNMTVGADMAGKVIELSTTTPGVTINPPAQVVPAGGGVLAWTITGALPGDTIHLIVIGNEMFAGPEEGWGLCCTQTIDITIPKDLDCPTKQPDIKIEKKADVERCTVAGGCKFTIRVTNAGDAPYNGPIVLDEVTLPGNATIDGGPNAPWVCAPLTSPMQCTHPVTVLNPGASIDLKLSFKPGPGWAAHRIRNCAKYNYGASGKAPFGDPNNDKACADIPLCDPNGTTIYDKQCQPPVERKADLQIRKIAREFCTVDGLCTYGIKVTNVGPVAHNGPLTVTDQFPGGAPISATFSPTPPWTCATLNPSTFQCDHPGIVLAPGASTAILVKAIVSLDYKDGKVENCAEVKAIPTETNLANNKACATAKLRRPNNEKPTLRITKTCRSGVAGGAVPCRITVSNPGTVTPTGPVSVNDAATIIGSGASATLNSVTPDGAEWSCSAVPAANLSCQIPGAVMTPGTSRYFDVSVQVNGGARFENCARGSFGPAPGDDIVYPFGQACDKGGTDIVVTKTGPAQCEAGKPCAFIVTIINNGDSDFSGPVQIGDALEIDGVRAEGVAIESIEPPFGCSPEPVNLPFGCTANLNIPAGASQAHVVTVTTPIIDISPNGASGRNCVGVTGDPVTIAPLGAAGAAAGEAGPYSCHPFRITKPEEVKQCSDGFVMNANGRCVCPEGTRFSQGRGRCVGDVAEPQEPQQPDEPKVDQPKLCKLSPGMIRTKQGLCVCPRGTELRNGACKKPVVDEPQCRLLPGQIRTKQGECVCPRGTELRNGACRNPQPPQCKLLPGQIRTSDNRCICPKGTTLGKRGCFKVELPPRQCTLQPGQIRTKDGKCICPRGTVLGRRGCVKIEQPQTQCPRGTKLINGECMRPVDDQPEVRRCPRGTVGIYPVCVKPEVVIPQRCPRGTVGRYPNCRQIYDGNDQPQIDLQLNKRLPQQDQQPDIR